MRAALPLAFAIAYAVFLRVLEVRFLSTLRCRSCCKLFSCTTSRRIQGCRSGYQCLLLLSLSRSLYLFYSEQRRTWKWARFTTLKSAMRGSQALKNWANVTDKESASAAYTTCVNIKKKNGLIHAQVFMRRSRTLKYETLLESYRESLLRVIWYSPVARQHNSVETILGHQTAAPGHELVKEDSQQCHLRRQNHKRDTMHSHFPGCCLGHEQSSPIPSPAP